MDDDDGRDNWDLSAVVKSCSSRNLTVTVQQQEEEEEPPLACLASLTFHDQQDNSSGFLQRYPDIGKYGSSFHSSYTNPFLSSMTTGNIDYLSDLVNPPPVTSLPSPDQLCPDLQPDVHASMSGIGPPPPLPSAPSPPVLFFQHKQLVHAGRPFNRIRTQDPPPSAICRFAAPHPSRSRKRKVQQKRTVTHVTADKLSSDEWAWRKYGQKPIKGSPYPRNYYRCSSSKGCSARKQVEQSKSDPEIYNVTFTGDHTHPRPSYRNSLAGSTRSRVGSSSQRLAAEASTEGSSSTLVSVTSSTAAPGVEEAETEGMVDVGSEEEEDEDLLIPNLVIDDDLFKGLEEFTSGGGFGQSLSSFADNFSASGDGGSSPAGGATAAASG